MRLARALFWIAMCLGCSGWARSPGMVVAQDTAGLRSMQRQFNQQIRPLLEAHCLDCHSGPAADAGLDLSGAETLDQLLQERRTWAKAAHRVAASEMPPEGSDPLAPADQQRFLAWVETLLSSVDCTTIDPGRVTIRRLNRTEYRNTVRALLGVDYQPADSFPGDDVGYGFDNIADVLSLPPILLEKYLDAAEAVTAEAIVDPDQLEFDRTWAGSDFAEIQGSRQYQQAHILTTRGTLRKRISLPREGEYELRVLAFGDQAGDEPVHLTIHLGAEDLGRRNVRADHEEDAETLEFTARLPAGDCELTLTFENDFYDASRPAGENDRNLHIREVQLRGPVDRVSYFGPRPVPEKQAESARDWIHRFAARAYRRPLQAEELDRLMGLYTMARQQGSSYELALRQVYQAVLISPHFLYRIELPAPPGEIRELGEFELATRLAFFLTSCAPDDELLKLAYAGQLRQPEVYRQQVERLLRGPARQALVDQFAVQWLQLGHLDVIQPDPDLFPGVDQALRRSMAEETKRVLADLMAQDASLLELLDTDFTYLNRALARHYGVPGDFGDAFVRVSAEVSGRRGLLSHASVLTLTSNPTRTSPVKRGKWIMENLLGEVPPPPDPAAMQLEDQQELQGTLRQRMEQHRANPNCASCHRVMDELGFALEHYDAVGQWRNEDEGLPIDDRGQLPDGTAFAGPVELQQTLRTTLKDKFVRCLIEKMLIYALGRGLEYYDECTIDEIQRRWAAQDYRFSELILAVATSDAFTKLRGPTAE